jgi:putative ABC transport system permease protein
VLLSAWLPVKKALKLSAIETIRQSDDIRIRSRQIKTSKLTQKLFGLEGTLASKNFKRNRRKYRATVFSLCLSIVLFISASSFCDYLNYSIKQFVETYDCDILYQSDNITEDTWFETFKNQSGITKAACIYELYDGELLADNSFLTEQAKSDSQSKTGSKSTVFAKMIFVDDDSYAAYLLEHGYDKSVYMDAENPTAIAVDTVSYITEDNKAGSYRAFAKENADVTYAASYGEEHDSGEQVSVHIGAVEENLPYGTQMLKGSVLLFYPKSAMKMLSNTDGLQLEMAFSSDNPDRAYNRMQLAVQSEDTLTGILNNIDSQIQINKGLMTVIQVFSYGFIVLISLIAMMNVFNTISTNIALRRREFAMLRSVGMTQRGFFKMMNYECFMYGMKGILFGLPIALLVTYLIYHTISNGLDMQFYVPWHSVVIAVGSVFLVVFVTMIYAMNGIRKDNVIETLKNENY